MRAIKWLNTNSIVLKRQSLSTLRLRDLIRWNWFLIDLMPKINHRDDFDSLNTRFNGLTHKIAKYFLFVLNVCFLGCSHILCALFRLMSCTTQDLNIYADSLVAVFFRFRQRSMPFDRHRINLFCQQSQQYASKTSVRMLIIKGSSRTPPFFLFAFK